MTELHDTPEIDEESLDRIRERLLQTEERHLHQQEARKIVPELKEVIEEEIKE